MRAPPDVDGTVCCCAFGEIMEDTMTLITAATSDNDVPLSGQVGNLVMGAAFSSEGMSLTEPKENADGHCKLPCTSPKSAVGESFEGLSSCSTRSSRRPLVRLGLRAMQETNMPTMPQSTTGRTHRRRPAILSHLLRTKSIASPGQPGRHRQVRSLLRAQQEWLPLSGPALSHVSAANRAPCARFHSSPP